MTVTEKHNIAKWIEDILEHDGSDPMPDGQGERIYMRMADRGCAAFYTAYHFPGFRPDERMETCALAADCRGVVVMDLREARAKARAQQAAEEDE